MLIYLLKSGACLAIFMACYTVFLERENMHVFKRYYLLAALIIAFAIPLVTFTHYIEVAPVSIANQPMEAMVYYTDDLPQIQETNYLPIILWSIYGFGVLVFATKFLNNLLQIIFKINRNPKQKSKHIIHVLLSDLITPHTFFKYIFLNKQKFENQEIPQAVFWHEETHARQKHSIDVLFVELLQVILWFNPLIYFTKQAIKMNHEFLADQAVLDKGINPSNYQHMLLAFSSNATEPQLANAINYSSIKKRFTVMKTQTSKRNIWLRSVLLLPLVALTLYGFSDKKEVIEKNTAYINENSEFINQEPAIIIAEDINITILKNGKIIINNNETSVENFKDELYGFNSSLTFEEREQLVHVMISSESEKLNHDDLKSFLKITDMLKLYGTFTVIFDETEKYINQEFYTLLNPKNDKGSSKIVTGENKIQQKATPEEIAEYNKLAKHYNKQTDDNRIIKMKDLKRIKELHDKMTTQQKTNAEPMPNFPPPPPPTTKDGSKNVAFVNQTISPPPPPPSANASEKQKKAYQKALEAYKIERESYTYKQTNPNGKVIDITVIPENDGMVPPPPPPAPPALKDNTQTKVKSGFVVANGEKLYYVEFSDSKTYYNRAGNKVDKNGKKLNGNVQVNASDVIPGQYITKVYSDDEIVVEFKNNHNQRDATLEIPAPPPPPASPLDHVIEMAKKNAVFFHEGKSISSDEAVKILKENGALNISTKELNSKEPQVYITKEPIKTSYDSGRTNKNVVSQKIETSTTYLKIEAETFNDLKNIDWNTFKDIFSNNNPETLVTIEFNYNNPILMNGTKVDSFNHKIRCKTSELSSYLEKSKKIIGKLSPIN